MLWKIPLFYVTAKWLAELCLIFFFLRLIAKKVCTAFSRADNKIVPLTNLNKYLYNGKRKLKVNINNSSGKAKKKKTVRLSVGQLQQNVLLSVMSAFVVHSGQVLWRVITDLLVQSVGVGVAVSKKCGCKSVDDNWDGFNVQSVVQVGKMGVRQCVSGNSQWRGDTWTG